MVGSVRSVTLATVAAALEPHGPVTLHGQDAGISDVHMDSRSVAAGSLYVAIRGAQVDGHRFVGEAAQRGATAALVEEQPEEDIPYLLVPDTRSALGWAAAAVHRHPAADLNLIGVTGTNGKTTVAHMLAAMACGSGRTMAVVGTVSANLPDSDISPRTTPEADNLQRVLRHLANGDEVTDVAVEVSSHAMEMGRVNGATFDVVAFTNLSQDHLDYHETMERYFAAKAKLFAAMWAPRGVAWVDDPWGSRLAAESAIPVFTVGTESGVDARVTYGSDTPGGSTFEIVIGDRALTVRTALAGRFNVANAAVSVACAHLQGWDLERSTAMLAEMNPIPGRYNTISNDQGIWVVVDYAHTSDAIANVIAQTRDLIPGKVIAIGGAGGDRDRKKRPLMGLALTDADLAIMTTDNPRSEDPNDILHELASAIPADRDYKVEADRRTAIRLALAEAAVGDAVLILGKGHETRQEFADGSVPFDDAAVAQEELAARRGRR